jgi:hypothetical protein
MCPRKPRGLHRVLLSAGREDMADTGRLDHGREPRTYLPARLVHANSDGCRFSARTIDSKRNGTGVQSGIIGLRVACSRPNCSQ